MGALDRVVLVVMRGLLRGGLIVRVGYLLGYARRLELFMKACLLEVICNVCASFRTMESHLNEPSMLFFSILHCDGTVCCLLTSC